MYSAVSCTMSQHQRNRLLTHNSSVLGRVIFKGSMGMQALAPAKRQYQAARPAA